MYMFWRDFLLHMSKRLLFFVADSTNICLDLAKNRTALQRVCNVQEIPRVYSISLRIWAEPADATQREQGHDG